MASYTTFWILIYLLLTPISMMHGVDKMITSFLQHCLGEKGDFQATYIICVYYVEWKIADHLPKGGVLLSLIEVQPPFVSVGILQEIK